MFDVIFKLKLIKYYANHPNVEIEVTTMEMRLEGHLHVKKQFTPTMTLEIKHRKVVNNKNQLLSIVAGDILTFQ